MRPAASGDDRERGYTLVGLMIAVALVNILLAVAVSSWVTLDRRAREAELLWRGQQIAAGIACFQQAQPSVALARLEQLVEASCLRRLYPDPMTKDGQWRVLTQQDVADGTVAALLGQVSPEEALAGAGGAPGAAPGLAGGGSIASGAGLGLARLFQRGPASRTTLSGGDGIVGVVSRAPGESLRTYLGRQKYGEWVFLPAAGTGG